MIKFGRLLPIDPVPTRHPARTGLREGIITDTDPPYRSAHQPPYQPAHQPNYAQPSGYGPPPTYPPPPTSAGALSYAPVAAYGPPPTYAPAPGYGPPPGYTAPPAHRSLDKLALWSFITGIISVLILSIPFSIAGLVRTRRGERRGRGFAIAGLALSVAWIVVIVGVSAYHAGRKPDRAADGSVIHQGSIPVTSLRPGDCLKVPPLTAGQPQRFSLVTVLPCSAPHNAQVFTTVQSLDRSYPGQTVLVDEALHDCRAPAATYLGTTSTTLLLLAVVPSEAIWDKGNRTERCLLVDSAEDITGDIRDHP